MTSSSARRGAARGQLTNDRAEDTVAAAVAGDESAFALLTERHRRELHVHC